MIVVQLRWSVRDRPSVCLPSGTHGAAPTLPLPIRVRNPLNPSTIQPKVIRAPPTTPPPVQTPVMIRPRRCVLRELSGMPGAIWVLGRTTHPRLRPLWLWRLAPTIQGGPRALGDCIPVHGASMAAGPHPGSQEQCPSLAAQI